MFYIYCLKWGQFSATVLKHVPFKMPQISYSKFSSSWEAFTRPWFGIQLYLLCWDCFMPQSSLPAANFLHFLLKYLELVTSYGCFLALVCIRQSTMVWNKLCSSYRKWYAELYTISGMVVKVIKDIWRKRNRHPSNPSTEFTSFSFFYVTVSSFPQTWIIPKWNGR